MPDFQTLPGGVCAPKGFRASGLHCGIRKNQDKKDLALILADAPCPAAAVYTTNKVQGAPIALTRAHLQNGLAQAMLCNSGNANTCNADGPATAAAMCEALAQAAGLDSADIIIASTGVIGQPLPLPAIEAAVPSLVSLLQPTEQGAMDAAEAILTTDTHDKQTAASFQLSGMEARIGAMAKGVGMIAPNMATLLCFVTTDAAIAQPLLQKALAHAVQQSFNRVVVDGDTSTNDMVSILASGRAGNPRIETESADYNAFQSVLTAQLTHLAREVARDGEGATKLLTCRVEGAPTDALAQAIARSVITSPLCKTMLFGADANCGRILCAIGYTPGDFRVDTISVEIASRKGSLLVCENGLGLPFNETDAKRILSEAEIDLTLHLHQGEGACTAWGCDLSYEYVRINGDYRT
jgi:glutamate N-acetyltransferase/amino-acid N-acetyltransferase